MSVGKYERSFNHQNLVDAIVTSIAKFNIRTGANAPRGDALIGACLSHTLTHPEEKFLLKNLQKFKEDICGLMHQNLAAAAHWVIYCSDIEFGNRCHYCVNQILMIERSLVLPHRHDFIDYC